MKKFDFFVTGKFDAAEIQAMREKADKPKALFEIGQHLRNRRQVLDLSRAAVAARCGLGADQLGRFEHGASDIGFEALDRVCVLLGVDAKVLLRSFLGQNAGVIVDLARSWIAQGKTLSVEEIVAIGASAPK